MLAAIIAVVMEVPAAILICLAFSPVRWRCCLFSTRWVRGDWSPLLGYDRRCGWAKYDYFWKNVSIAGAFLLLAITGPGQFLSIGVRKDAGCGVNALSAFNKLQPLYPQRHL